MDRYVCLKQSDVFIPVEEEESSEDEDDGDEDEDEGEEGEEDGEGLDDGASDTTKWEPVEVEEKSEEKEEDVS